MSTTNYRVTVDIAPVEDEYASLGGEGTLLLHPEVG